MTGRLLEVRSPASAVGLVQRRGCTAGVQIPVLGCCPISVCNPSHAADPALCFVLQCRDGTPQCFLLTPKLLPNLPFTRDVSVLQIMNGGHIKDVSEAAGPLAAVLWDRAPAHSLGVPAMGTVAGAPPTVHLPSRLWTGGLQQLLGPIWLMPMRCSRMTACCLCVHAPSLVSVCRWPWISRSRACWGASTWSCWLPLELS